jgi:hypothetical protein
VALPGAYAPASIAVGARKPPLHDKAVVLEEGLANNPSYGRGLDDLQSRSERGDEGRNLFPAGNITQITQLVGNYLTD